MIILHNEPDLPPFKTMFAFLVVGDDGGEGLAAFHNPLHGWVPLVGGNLSLLDQAREKAQELARATGRDIRLVLFREREELEVIKP